MIHVRKGGNQAVAAARLGARVSMVANLGTDLFGDAALTRLEEESIDCTHVSRDEDRPSGVALISVDSFGENQIVVAPGANGALSASHVERAFESIPDGSIILLQLEIPMATVRRAVELAQASRCRVVLDPAPAQPLPSAVVEGTFLITPNATEAAMLTGVSVDGPKSARRAAGWRRRQLELAARDGAPQALLGVRHEAQGQFLRHEAFDQPVRIRKIALAPAAPAIRLRLREVQRPPPRRRRDPGRPMGLPVPLQHLPHGAPILRRRFHHDFLNLLRHQPGGQLPELARAGAHPPTRELIPARHGDIGDHHGQHPLVYINPGNAVRHHTSLRPEWSACQILVTQAHRLPDREGPAPNYSLNDSRRISQFYGLHTSTGSSTSPLRTTPSLPKVGLFFMNFRELTRDPQPQVTGGREGTDAHNSVDRH